MSKYSRRPRREKDWWLWRWSIWSVCQSNSFVGFSPPLLRHQPPYSEPLSRLQFLLATLLDIPSEPSVLGILPARSLWRLTRLAAWFFFLPSNLLLCVCFFLQSNTDYYWTIRWISLLLTGHWHWKNWLNHQIKSTMCVKIYVQWCGKTINYFSLWILCDCEECNWK